MTEDTGKRTQLAAQIREEKCKMFSTPDCSDDLMEMIERDFGKDTPGAANVVRIVMFAQNLALESAAEIVDSQGE